MVAALMSKTATMKTTTPSAHTNIFSFEASCSYLLVSTSSWRAPCNFILACFILSEAIFNFKPIPSTSCEVSRAICLITDINFSISFSSSSYSCNSFMRIESPSYRVAWICLCLAPISWCDYLMWSSFIDSSFFYISSAENDSKNYFTFVFSLIILSEFYWISIRLFCLSINEACSFWN